MSDEQRSPPAMMDHQSEQIQTNQNGHNGWTLENEKTVRRWQKDIEKASFVYSEIRDQLELYIKRVHVSSLIGSATVGILSGLCVALGSINAQETVRWVIFAFNIVSVVIAGIVFVLNCISTVLSWEKQIKDLTRFVEQLDSSWFILEAEMIMASEERVKASDFIKRNDGAYLYLMQHCPQITADDYLSVSDRYQQRLAENLIRTQRFRSVVIET